jgi:hypothetical protein
MAWPVSGSIIGIGKEFVSPTNRLDKECSPLNLLFSECQWERSRGVKFTIFFRASSTEDKT